MTAIKGIMDWIDEQDFLLGEFGDGQREFQSMVKSKLIEFINDVLKTTELFAEYKKDLESVIEDG